MIDLGSAVPWSSSDVTNALLAFFAIGPVMAVLALIMAVLVAVLIRDQIVGWRGVIAGWGALERGVGEPDVETADFAFSGPWRGDDWQTVEGDLPGWNMEYHNPTGAGVSWRESTPAEVNEAAAASGDYSGLQFSWSGSPSYTIDDENGNAVARVYEDP